VLLGLCFLSLPIFCNGIIFFFLSKGEYSLVLKRKYLLEGARYSFPLIFHSLGGVIFMYSGAFFIKNIISISALGVFSVADRLSQVTKAVVNSFNNVYSPLYTKINLKAGEEKLGVNIADFPIPHRICGQ